MGTWRLFGHKNRGGRTRLVVMLGLAGFVVGVYVLVVLGGGALIGRTDSPSLPLSVLATAVVALGFAPLQAALEWAATTLGHPGATTPYDVLSRFSETVTGGAPPATKMSPAMAGRSTTWPGAATSAPRH